MKARSTIGLLSVITLTGLAVSEWSEGIAQNFGFEQERLHATMVIPTTQEHISAADQQLKNRVENALRSDPYFYSEHVNVSVKNGSVVLEGFVFSDWDLRDAIRIATKAAGGGRVIDNLTIEVGGRR
jgi:BON domain